VTFRKLVIPHDHVEHKEAYALLCMSCETPLEIDWNDKSGGFAFCSCGRGYGYKIPYSKFVRIK
jgi:hypothetical protein